MDPLFNDVLRSSEDATSNWFDNTIDFSLSLPLLAITCDEVLVLAGKFTSVPTVSDGSRNGVTPFGAKPFLETVLTLFDIV